MTHLRLISVVLLGAVGLPACTDERAIPEAPLGSSPQPPSKPTPAPTTPEPAATPVTPITPGSVTRMPLGTLFQLQQADNVLIYDVRPTFTRALGSIPGSVSWPKNAYESQLATREPEIRAATAAGKPVVFYCTDLACPDATTVATRLAARGHKVSVLQGGWDAWKAGGLPAQ